MSTQLLPKSLIRIIFAVLFGAVTLSQTSRAQTPPSWQWAQSVVAGLLTGYIPTVTPIDLKVDANGTSFIQGQIIGTGATFGNQTVAGASTVTAVQFLACYDAKGNVVWAKHPGECTAPASASVTDILPDGSGGLYVSGRFGDTIVFGSYTLTTPPLFPGIPGSEAYLVHYNATGTVTMARKQARDTSTSLSKNALNVPVSIAMDHHGNIYGACAPFVMKWASNGDLIWRKQIQSELNGAKGLLHTLTVDGSDNVYVSWGVPSKATVGSFSLTPAGGNDYMIAKLGSDGSVIWAKLFGNANTDQLYGLTADKNGNVYFSGNGIGSLTIGTSTLDLGAGPNAKGYVAKLDPSGTAKWAYVIDNGTFIEVSLNTDDAGNLYFSSYYPQTFAFRSFTLPTGGYSVGYIMKVDSNANVIWGEAGGLNECFTGVTPGGAVYAAGSANLNWPASAVFGSITLNIPASSTAMYVGQLGQGAGTTLTPPLNLLPPSGTALLDTTVTLRWGSVANAISYELEVSTDSTFSNTPFLDAAGLADTTRFVTGLMRSTTYYWRARALIQSGTRTKGAAIQGQINGPWSNALSFKTPASTKGSVAEAAGITPGSLTNFPNPCTNSTTINFSLQRSESVALSVRDLLGRELIVYPAGLCGVGEHTVELSLAGLPNGFYNCEIKTSTGSMWQSIVLRR